MRAWTSRKAPKNRFTTMTSMKSTQSLPNISPRRTLICFENSARKTGASPRVDQKYLLSPGIIKYLNHDKFIKFVDCFWNRMQLNVVLKNYLISLINLKVSISCTIFVFQVPSSKTGKRWLIRSGTTPSAAPRKSTLIAFCTFFEITILIYYLRYICTFFEITIMFKTQYNFDA